MKLAVLIMMMFGAPLSACCMVPFGYPGDVDQSAQRVVLVHRAKSGDTPGYEEMIIQVQPFFQNADTNPEYMAWVLTLPSKPLRYDIATKEALDAGPELHERLFKLARKQWADKTGFEWPDFLPGMLTARAPADAKALGVIVDDAVTVGPYVITPVRATGLEGLEALNAYLGERGFPKEPADHLKYFVENDFTFLCVRVDPKPGQSQLGRALDLPPLVVGFETETPYYPGKFSSRQGNFALDLTIISDGPLETDAFGLQRRRLSALKRGYVELVNLYTLKALPDVLSGVLGERAREMETPRWYVNRIQSEGFNDPSKEGAASIATWEDDVFFPLGDTTDEIPGFWYYSDEDISFVERFFREHAMAFFVGTGMFFFVTLFIKVRINRKRYLAEQNKPKA
ncbi:MAG: DUF2330 domain-containing protein [Planctomycetes bacterium]|nr:DUF2330 domain-containing protein [Planctomycetota bacterium]